MGSTNHGIQKTSAVEVRGGLTFYEDFESQAEVELNGGTVGSGISFSNGKAVFNNTVNAKIIYNNPLKLGSEVTIILKGVVFNSVQTQACFVAYATGTKYSIALFGGDLYTQNAAGGGVGIKPFTPVVGQSYDIAVTAGANGQFYINGVAFGASFGTGGMDVVIDTIGYTPSRPWPFDGTIDDVLVFNRILTPAEILAYYNGTMWDYDQHCVLALPMLLRDHDADNVRTLDRSGNGNHATFGDGSTASTYPTFNDGKYAFDGNDDYMDTKSSTLVANTEQITVAALFCNKDIITNSRTLVSHGSAVGGNSWFFQNSAASADPMQFRVTIGGSLKDARLGIRKNEIAFLCGTHDLNVVRLYDGNNVAETAAVGNRDACTTNVLIGEDGYGTNFLGDLYCVFIYNTALNPTQILDLQMRMEENFSLGRRGI